MIRAAAPGLQWLRGKAGATKFPKGHSGTISASPGYPKTKWEPRGKEALHSSRRPEHRRQPRCRVGVVGCHWRKQRAPGWGRSTLPGCGQERRPRGPATSSKQREKEKKVKTGGDHCRSPPKDTPRLISQHSVPIQSGNQEHLPGIGLLARQERPDLDRRGSCYHQTLQKEGFCRSFLVAHRHLDTLSLASLSWTGYSVHPGLILLSHTPGRPGHNTQRLPPSSSCFLSAPRVPASLWLPDTNVVCPL